MQGSIFGYRVVIHAAELDKVRFYDIGNQPNKGFDELLVRGTTATVMIWLKPMKGTN